MILNSKQVCDWATLSRCVVERNVILYFMGNVY